jgi:hypothetical protein
LGQSKCAANREFADFDQKTAREKPAADVQVGTVTGCVDGINQTERLYGLDRTREQRKHCEHGNQKLAFAG